MTAADRYPNHYYRATRYLGVATVLGGLFCAVGYGSDSFAVFALPIFFATFAFAGFVGCWLTGWALERSLRFFREGKALGRWEVEGAQWLEFARARRQKLATAARWAVVVLAFVVIVAVGVLYDDPTVLSLVLTLIGVMALGVFVMVRLVAYRPYAPGITRALIEIGPGVALINGHILSFAGFGQTLTGLELDEERGVLIIRGRTQADRSPVPFEHELPYPPEAKDQAVMVMAGLGYGYGLSAAEDA